MFIGFTSENVWWSLAQIGLGLAAIGAVAAFIVWRGRRKGRKMLILDVALTLSGWWVMISALGTVISCINVLTGAAGFPLDAPALSVEWPGGLPCSAETNSSHAVLSCGAALIDSPWVMNAGIGVRVLAAAAIFCTGVLNAIPALLIAVICFQTLRGRPFSATVTRTFIAAAFVVVTLGIAEQLLSQIGGTLALREALPPDNKWYPMAFQLSLDGLPVAAALALVALAAVLHQGFRLQVEKAALERETEGLV